MKENYFFLLQNEARKLNHQEVVEEDRRKKLPTNWDAIQRRLEWENKEEEAKKVIKLLYAKVHCTDVVIASSLAHPFSEMFFSQSRYSSFPLSSKTSTFQIQFPCGCAR